MKSFLMLALIAFFIRCDVFAMPRVDHSAHAAVSYGSALSLQILCARETSVEKVWCTLFPMAAVMVGGLIWEVSRSHQVDWDDVKFDGIGAGAASVFFTMEF